MGIASETMERSRPRLDRVRVGGVEYYIRREEGVGVFGISMG